MYATTLVVQPPVIIVTTILHEYYQMDYFGIKENTLTTKYPVQVQVLPNLIANNLQEM